MDPVETIEELIQNIDTVEQYLAEGDQFETDETVKLVKRGTCFLAYTIRNEVRFAPSRFIGYKRNFLIKHQKSHKDGRVTNKAINEILGAKPSQNRNLEDLYLKYCTNLGIEPNEKGTFGVERKYWSLDIKEDFSSNQQLTGEFPEGKVVERKHRARERNSAVVNMAKQNFKNLHGKIFCQACGFDFEKHYGDIGKGFIEGHHLVPVSEMKQDHKTKPEDIALLCSNCHRMVHKRRPWLKLPELKSLLTSGSN